MVTNVGIFVSNNIVRPARNFLGILFGTCAVVVTRANTMRARYVTVIYNGNMMLRNLHLVFFCSSTRFVTSACSFVVRFLFYHLFRVDRYFFAFV